MVGHANFHRSVAGNFNEITGKPTDQIVPTIQRFIKSRFLCDYNDNVKLLMRLNQVMKRVPQLSLFG